MLPNHAPLVGAEEFGTMHAIYGDRLDLGLGRAPGTDMATANAIRRSNHDGVFSFKSEIEELKRYLSAVPTQVVAYPGQGTEVPLYVLGSSTDSAHIRSEEHTSELQSRGHLVCRLLLEKKNMQSGATPTAYDRVLAIR